MFETTKRHLRGDFVDGEYFFAEKVTVNLPDGDKEYFSITSGTFHDEWVMCPDGEIVHVPARMPKILVERFAGRFREILSEVSQIVEQLA